MTEPTTLAGVFRGFRPGALFKLSDNTFWLQADDHMVLHHAVDPLAHIVNLDDGQFLKVDGIGGMVLVHPIHHVIESRIQGRFAGWTGKTVYRLSNGQTWQQAKYMTKYVVKYMPDVLIWHTPTGTAVMEVAGTSCPVKQIS